MINLEISNYPTEYSHLNGQQTMNKSLFDLARAMITVGRGSWTDTFGLGIFRIGELLCKALAFSKIEHGNFVLQDRFYNLNQSEKATVSYYFGQGLTKLYAEEFFKIPWLFHVDDYDSFIQYNIFGIAPSKLIVGKTKKNADRPDLIGIKHSNVSHIFEAKGNSGGYDTSVMQHAINQVSQVRTYNSVVPLTRTACYFDLSTTPIRGIIIDPENDENGVEFQLSEESVIKKYYSFFTENNQYFTNSFQVDGYEFLTTPVGVPNIFFGFDKRLLKLNPAELLSKGLYGNEKLFVTESNRFNQVSLGLDGLILIDAR
jgi:hypothetical protein